MASGATGRWTDFTLQVDAQRWGIYLHGATVPDTANNWLIMQNNSMAYMDFLTYSISDVDTILFQPITMIIGDTLPDRQGVAQNGTFTWGINPQGVAVTLGALISSGQPSVGGAIEEDTRDILPEVEVSDWFGDGTITKAATLVNPFRPFITMMSDNTTLVEIQVWRLLGLALLFIVVVGTGSVLRGHVGITVIVASVTLGILVAFDSNIFPVWLLVLMLGGLVGGIIAERSPIV